MEPFTRQEEEQQAYARLHRYGQKKDVRVTIYFSPVTVESRLLFWRKRSEEKTSREGNSTNYVYTQLFEEEEDDSDNDDIDLTSSETIDGAMDRARDGTMDEEDAEEASEEPADDNLRTRFLLGLVDTNGNSTTRDAIS